MPQVNGKPYRTFGQGYAAEKSKMGADSNNNEAGDAKDKGGQKGSVLRVKHMGGGKFKVKDDSGQSTEHASAEDLHEHMADHFGLKASDGSDQGEDSYDDDGDEDTNALKSILG